MSSFKEIKFQRYARKQEPEPSSTAEVNQTNLRDVAAQEESGGSSSSGSGSSSSSRSTSTHTHDSSRPGNSQPHTVESLQHKLGLFPKQPSQDSGVREAQLTLRRISLKDTSLPDVGGSEFSTVPIDNFGQRMMKEMGISASKLSVYLCVNNFAEPISMGMGDPQRDLGVDKRPTQPILFVPRPEGMGIGAVSKQDLLAMIRRGQEVTDRDLRGRHTNHVVGVHREAPPENPRTCTLVYGEEVTIVEGKYEGLVGKVVGGDSIRVAGEPAPPEDENATDAELGLRAVVIQLQINDKNVKLVRKNVEKGKAVTQKAETKDGPEREEKKKKKHKWVRPGLVCRIVSQKYRGGKYMDELGQIIDLPDCHTVSLQTNSQELLEDIEEKHLETVMPMIGEKVMIVKGVHVGVVGILNERKKKENKVVVRIELADGGLDYIHLTQEDCCALVGSKLKS